MKNAETNKSRSKPLLGFAFVALSLFMYVSIMYKIINYGP